jgi:parallel beta-helix repeat protein
MKRRGALRAMVAGVFAQFSSAVSVDSASALEQQAAASAQVPTKASATSVNVRSFGATGTGKADDSAAFAAAVSAVTEMGGIVNVPPGVYVVSTKLSGGSAILLPSRVGLVGSGPGASIIRLAANAENAISVVGAVRGASNIAVRDLTLQVNRTENANGTFGIRLETVSHCLIDHVRAEGTTSHGIVLDKGSTENTIANCEVVDFGQGNAGFGILCFNGSSRNRVIYNTVHSLSGQVGICADAGTTTGDAAPASANLFHGNVVEGGRYGILIEDSDDCSIDNNVLIGQTEIAILLQPGQANLVPRGTRVSNNHITRMHPATFGAAIDVKASETYVTGNVVRDSGNVVGIKCERPSGFSHRLNIISHNFISGLNGAAILVEGGSQHRVTGNVITNIRDVGILVRPLEPLRHLVVSCNEIDTIIGTGNHGIRLASESAALIDIRVCDNVIRNVGIGGMANGIVLEQNPYPADHIEVRGNRVIDDQLVRSCGEAFAVLGRPTAVNQTDNELLKLPQQH